MAHTHKPDFCLSAKRTSRFKSAGGVSSVDCWQPRCAASAVVRLDTPCSEVVWRVLATHSIRQFPLHFPSRATPCVASHFNWSLPWTPTILTGAISAIILRLGRFLPYPLQFIIPHSCVYFALLTASPNEQWVNKVIHYFKFEYLEYFYSSIQIKRSTTYRLLGNF